MIIGTETTEGEAEAEVETDMNRTGIEQETFHAGAGVAVLVLIMTGNIAGAVAHLHREALVVAEATHLVGHLLLKELLAGPEMTVLHALEALQPKMNALYRLSWTT